MSLDKQNKSSETENSEQIITQILIENTSSTYFCLNMLNCWFG